MHGGRSTGARCASLVLAALAIAGCGSPGEPALDGAVAAQAGASVADLPPGLLDELAAITAEALPAVAERISDADAETIGRRVLPAPSGVGAAHLPQPLPQPADLPAVPVPQPVPQPADLPAVPVPQPVPVNPSVVAAPPQSGRPVVDEPMVLEPGVDAFVGQRVLESARPALDASGLGAPAGLVPHVRAPRLAEGAYSTVEGMGQDPTVSAAERLRSFGPEVIPWTTAIATALADHDDVAPLLRVGPGSEPAVVAAHGRAHLALTLVVAGIVVPAAEVPIAGSDPAVVVGAAVEAATAVLRARPVPDDYAAALAERRRAEYAVPNYGSGEVALRGPRFGLVEGSLPAGPTEPANGLVAVVPGGLVVRTGAESGSVPVVVHVLPGPPPEDPEGRDIAIWHEVVDVSFTATTGAASVRGDAGAADARLQERTPPWPGSMRARVAAHGRDDEDGERYEILVWAAPPAPEVVLKATDRLGHRLRGEPEPPVVVRPESAYRWLRDSSLAFAATVTVVTGSSTEQVVEAFGGDPARPVPVDEALLGSVEPWVAVLPVDGAVIAVEPNGWQGSHDEVLRAASARGRAASMYWGGDADTNLAFAAGGEVLDSFEPLFEHTAPDERVRAALDGIDWVDYTDLHEKGLVAVERFTGHGVRAQDVERIDAAAIAYRVPQHP